MGRNERMTLLGGGRRFTLIDGLVFFSMQKSKNIKQIYGMEEGKKFELEG